MVLKYYYYIESQNNVPNCNDGYIGGVMDLPDFLPLHLGLSGLIRTFGVGPAITYRFSELSGNLSIICTELVREDAGKYLAEECNAAGENAGLTLLSAMASNIGGYTIPGTVIQSVKSDFRKGVVIAEGYQNGSQPLVLEVVSNGVVLCSAQIPLCVSEITDMYRTADLRAGAAAFPPEPPNYPDSETNGKTVIFLHGFSVSSSDATVWFNEMFKRLYRSGSRARFLGVKWKGDEGAVDGLNYHQNVVNAFNTASNLAMLVNSIPGEKIIMAHSLGNMVVASAIADHGMQVNKYFMFNAAIPAEAFDASQWSTNLQTQTSEALIPSAWADYPVLSWCSAWHMLFGNADSRFKLKWPNRVSNIPATILYNYYSLGDNVLELSADGPPDILTGTISDWGRYAWNKQEVFKGVGCVAGTTWAGWGFARNAPESTVNHSQMYMNAQDAIATNTLNPETFISWPVFRPNPSAMFSSNIEFSVCNEILAKGIPALSGPSGSKSMSILEQDRDRDMNSISRPNGWPRISGDYAGLWLHSDLKDVSFFHNHKLFSEIVTKGELK